MLELINITKEYPVHNGKVVALKNVSLNFRRNEFVAILGPSGCGKTTMLNILGGLDRYSDGDLKINGVSTKTYKDREWDVYRNHSVGFVFQSYNLIPHQTILGNVELALTIGGISKAERVERAKIALDKVGLAGEYYKRPNQLSGGQMQRVAIARALVNDPEIILADEPTGALDTKTSVQVMDLLKEVAKDRLVVMVTHNPELADKYATRIVRLLDGEVLSDTMPYLDEDAKKDVAEYQAIKAQEEKDAQKAEESTVKSKKSKKKNKAKMSLFTTFRLSAQNLFTKKARTIMTSVAGAIGIIGVSLVLSLSYGIQGYINGMQNDMLSGNPIKIEQSAYDISSLAGSLTQEERNDIIREEGYINVDNMVQRLINMSKTADNIMIENTITQDYIDFVNDIPSEHIAEVHYDYGIDMTGSIYTEHRRLVPKDGGEEGETEVKVSNMSVNAIRGSYIEILNKTIFEKYASYVTSVVQNFQQAPTSAQYLLEQYELIGEESRIATEKDEIMLVLDTNDLVTDVLLAQLGYYSQEEFLHLICKAEKEVDADFMAWYGDEEYKKDKFSVEEILGKEFEWFPNDVIYSDEKLGITGALSATYSPYRNPDWTIAQDVENAGANEGIKLKVVGILRPKDGVSYGCLSGGFYYTEALAKHAIETGKTSRIINALSSKNGIKAGDKVQSSISYTVDYTYLGETKDTDKIYLGDSSLSNAFAGVLSNGMIKNLAFVTLQNLGGVDLPSSISIYPTNFEHKQAVLNYLDKWNHKTNAVSYVVNGETKTISREDRDNIVYTDMLSLVIGMLNQFIEIITIALVGFTSLSLVVSTFMIAIITYVSVVERVKEIGIIRSLGGRKKDVSRLFTAETVMIGFASGAFGIGVTYLVSALINAIVGALAGITIAIFPVSYAVIMMAISIVLTLISGVFPASAAAKKDPVIALRTE